MADGRTNCGDAPMTICWYCQTMIDVDEAIEGHAEIHTECLLEMCSGGSWDVFVVRAQRQRREHERAIDRIDEIVTRRRAALLASA